MAVPLKIRPPACSSPCEGLLRIATTARRMFKSLAGDGGVELPRTDPESGMLVRSLCVYVHYESGVTPRLSAIVNADNRRLPLRPPALAAKLGESNQERRPSKQDSGVRFPSPAPHTHSMCDSKMLSPGRDVPLDAGCRRSGFIRTRSIESRLCKGSARASGGISAACQDANSQRRPIQCVARRSVPAFLRRGGSPRRLRELHTICGSAVQAEGLHVFRARPVRAVYALGAHFVHVRPLGSIEKRRHHVFPAQVPKSPECFLTSTEAKKGCPSRRPSPP